MDDGAFLGVLLRSLAWSAVFFLGLHGVAIWAIHRVADLHGMAAWLADWAATFGASLLAMWLFLPVAAVIGTFYIDRIAEAVERRHYPMLPRPEGAPLIVQAWDGLSLGLRILLLNLLALLLAVFIPGVGLVLGWAIAGYGIGRGLFFAVAMRRMPRLAAKAIYLRARVPVLVQGGIMAAAAYVPGVNLLIPILGTAAMVHVLDLVVSESHYSSEGFR